MPRTKAPEAAGARKGSTTAKILALMERPGGAASKELMKATEWQLDSARGFLSGVLAKKMGLKRSMPSRAQRVPEGSLQRSRWSSKADSLPKGPLPRDARLLLTS
jgi:hypothetical protein